MQLKRLMARLSVLAEELRSEGNEELALRVESAIAAMRCSDPAYRLSAGGSPPRAAEDARKPEA